MKPKISIVMTYYERYNHLKNTLRSFALHGYSATDIEVIVVDDASPTEPLNQDIANSMPFPIKVIEMPKEKEYSNPCIPFNKGFAMARADVVIIQNAECIHVHNIVDYTLRHITDTRYLSFSCYSIDRPTTMAMFANENWRLADLKGLMNSNIDAVNDGDDAWYNHSDIRPKGFHFCSAITKTNLDAFNGFDSRYAKGIAFDDNEIVYRIRKIGLELRIINEASVIHQWHYSGAKDPKYGRKFARNGLLYELVTKRENGYVGGQITFLYLLFLIVHPILIPIYNFLLSRKKKRTGVAR